MMEAGKIMKGLELARAYFCEYGEPMLEREFPEYKDRIAAGLVGEGSECLGFDDEFSRDHDFGPGFCIWLPETLYSSIGGSLQQAYDRLPKEFGGQLRLETRHGAGRVGPMTIEGFYQKFTGMPQGPESNLQWLRIPEHFLATATNGQVFHDSEGIFTRIREHLLQFYPEDVRKKKLAAKMVIMAQSGQYNYGRCVKRMDGGAAYFACCEFVKAALGVIFLLNKIYMPFYKWAFKRVEDCQDLKDTAVKVKYLAALSDTKENFRRKQGLIEEICADVRHELGKLGYLFSNEDFLADQGERLLESIEDPELRRIHIMVDVG